MSTNGTTALPAKTSGGARGKAVPDRARVSSAAVWQALAKASFAVVSHVNAAGEPRSSGVVYGTADRRLYFAVAPDGWKARQITTGQEVAVTVPVRRGGILSLLAPIPPATITFVAKATVHPAGSFDIGLGAEGAREARPRGAPGRGLRHRARARRAVPDVRHRRVAHGHARPGSGARPRARFVGDACRARDGRGAEEGMTDHAGARASEGETS